MLVMGKGLSADLQVVRWPKCAGRANDCRGEVFLHSPVAAFNLGSTTENPLRDLA